MYCPTSPCTTLCRSQSRGSTSSRLAVHRVGKDHEKPNPAALADRQRRSVSCSIGLGLSGRLSTLWELLLSGQIGIAAVGGFHEPRPNRQDRLRRSTRGHTGHLYRIARRVYRHGPGTTAAGHRLLSDQAPLDARRPRSDERPVGKERFCTVASRWLPPHTKK